jgi:hypothetical protein
MTGSTFTASSADQFNSSNVSFDAQGCATTIPAGTTANLDLLLQDDVFVVGLQCVAKGVAIGDSASLQVVDTAGETGAPAGTVLGQYASNWQMSGVDGIQVDIETPNTPAKAPAGLTLRVVYTSTGTSPVQLGINYRLYKALF